MKNKFFYGTKPHINNYDPKDFSRGDYECCQLFHGVLRNKGRGGVSHDRDQVLPAHRL